MTPGVDVNKLNGKEREYIARSTGTPLMGNVSANARPSSSSEQPVGLVGAIAQRELERKHLRDMSRSTAVQQALVSQNVQRQQAEAAHQRYSTIINPQMYPAQWQPRPQQGMMTPQVNVEAYHDMQYQQQQAMSTYAPSVYGMPTSITPPLAQHNRSFSLNQYPTQQQSMHDLQQAARAKIQHDEEERQRVMLGNRQSMGMPGAWPGSGAGQHRGSNWG